MSDVHDLDALVGQARKEFSDAANPAALEEAKARFLGKTGPITTALKSMGALGPDEKKIRGAAINNAKNLIESALDGRRAELADAEMQKQLEADALDVSLAGRTRGSGGLHPISKTMERFEAIFGSMGFDVADGPELENDWFSFTALNEPENHPARSMQDTFYIDINDADGRPLNLRPHTSPMQIRYASGQVQAWEAVHGKGSAGTFPRMPDIRVIAPGRTYRVDNDATHSPMFHQCEGLWLGESVSFKDLKVVLGNFFRAYFETDELDLRFRPSYFPFTEPSAEVDIAFSSGPLKGRWLEVGGCGQVHPVVVANYGLDPESWIGFAFGMGLDRLTMLRYGVSDLRLFFEGDLRFLSQFNQ